jgi:hypothetical protein
MSDFIGTRAVIVGAGMGWLTAARALVDYFEQVLVLERDALPRDPEDRVGIPQGKHVHALLAGGQHALGELFPGFEDDLAPAGAVPIREGLDVRTERLGYDPFPQRDLGWVVYALSGHSWSSRCDGGCRHAPTSSCVSAVMSRSSCHVMIALPSPACGARTATGRPRP